MLSNTGVQVTVASDYKKLQVSTIVTGVDKIVLGASPREIRCGDRLGTDRQTDRHCRHLKAATHSPN